MCAMILTTEEYNYQLYRKGLLKSKFEPGQLLLVGAHGAYPVQPFDDEEDENGQKTSA